MKDTARNAKSSIPKKSFVFIAITINHHFLLTPAKVYKNHEKDTTGKTKIPKNNIIRSKREMAEHLIFLGFSMLNLSRNGNLLNIPLFFADRTEQLCQALLGTEF